MKKIILSILFLFCSYFSIAQEKEIKAVLEKQRLDWNNGDMIGYMQRYLKSDSLVFVGKTGPFYGWQKNLEIYQQVYPDKAAMGTLIFDIKQIKMIDKKNAFVLGAWNLQMEKGEQKGFFTLLVEKFKEGWKIVVDHSS
ncbi:YybH family protein [Flavobacterium sp. XS1P32]|uniref:YybH family protein n=1 Tax=Flavobacterium sp. XS1P32 TaxID=3401726 RepID=UPI003AAE040F